MVFCHCYFAPDLPWFLTFLSNSLKTICWVSNWCNVIVRLVYGSFNSYPLFSRAVGKETLDYSVFFFNDLFSGGTQQTTDIQWGYSHLQLSYITSGSQYLILKGRCTYEHSNFKKEAYQIMIIKLEQNEVVTKIKSIICQKICHLTLWFYVGLM